MRASVRIGSVGDVVGEGNSTASTRPTSGIRSPPLRRPALRTSIPPATRPASLPRSASRNSSTHWPLFKALRQTYAHTRFAQPLHQLHLPPKIIKATDQDSATALSCRSSGSGRRRKAQPVAPLQRSLDPAVSGQTILYSANPPKYHIIKSGCDCRWSKFCG